MTSQLVSNSMVLWQVLHTDYEDIFDSKTHTMMHNLNQSVVSTVATAANVNEMYEKPVHCNEFHSKMQS